MECHQHTSLLSPQWGQSCLPTDREGGLEIRSVKFLAQAPGCDSLKDAASNSLFQARSLSHTPHIP